MHSRWYGVAVVVLWLASMSWLVKTKVLPAMITGDPPSFRTIVEAQRGQPAVGWAIFFSGRRIGSALSAVKSLPSGMTEVRSRVYFARLPLEELMPSWLRALFQSPQRLPMRFQVDVRSKLMVDGLGRLSGFDSTVRLNPPDRTIHLRGAVEGTTVNLSLHFDEFSYRTEMNLPSNGILGDALSPQTELPGLRAGQTWAVPSCNPLSPREPLENLQAEVEHIEPILWNDRKEYVWLVVYRSDPGSKLGADSTARQQLWVRRDGTVLKQQITVLGSQMVFVRMSDADSAALEALCGSDILEEQPALASGADYIGPGARSMRPRRAEPVSE